jgi:hypothetical protein
MTQMTQKQIKERLSSIADKLSNIQLEVDDIMSVAVEDMYEKIYGSLQCGHEKGIDGEITELLQEIDKLDGELDDEETTQGKKEEK